nr:hypothetical protein [uncultured bacterium]
MSFDFNLLKDWNYLNELERQSQAKEDERSWRDVEECPWTDEDRAAAHRIIQEMSGRLARIEQRQAVIFRALHSGLSLLYFVVGGLAVLALVFLIR